MSLPSGYTQVEYIESSGTQYIDTGFMPNSDTRVVIDVQATNTTDGVFFGGRNSTACTFTFFLLGGRYRTDFGNASIIYISLDPTVRRIIDKNKNITTVEGTEYTNTSSTFATSTTMTLLAVNTAGTISYKISAKLYSCQIYDNGTLVRDYVPCIDHNGNVGLYDLVGGAFYGNVGTGAFSAGPVIVSGLSAPENFFAALSDGAVVLTWDAVKDAVGYMVRRNGVKIANTNETNYTDIEVQKWQNYIYSVSGYNEELDGSESSVSILVSSDNPLLDLVVDRAQSDVNRVRELAAKGWANMSEEEQAEWSSGLKGAYNASDLNRVGAAVAYLAGRFNALGHSVEVEPKQNWLVSDMPTSEQMTAYLDSVSYLRSVVAVFPTTPEVPDDTEGLTYTEANNIEQILLDLDLIVKDIIAAWYYSGELYAGEV